MSAINAQTRNTMTENVFGNNDLDVGKILIAALTNFIIPLIEGNTMAPGIGPDTSYTLSHPITEDQQRSVDSTVLPGARLTIEGQGLLIALAQFAASIMDSSNSDQVERQSPENLDQFRGVASRCASPVASDSDESDYSDVLGLECSTHVPQLEERDEYMWEISEHYLIDAAAARKKQQLFKKAMDEARDMVFNKMPIRMLMFDEAGNNIKLVERPQVMEYVSAELNCVRVCADLSLYNKWQFTEYAILSHSWLPTGEITYSKWTNHAASLDTQSPGYTKLANFCKVAATYGYRLAWMDTVCINKESSAELDESIRSMFKWYKGAEVCIAYLAETTLQDDMEKDNWFTRGWTLQELLAPHCIKFFSKEWTALSRSSAGQSDKTSGPLIPMICKATGLDTKELSQSPNFDSIPIWRKMQWAANRTVTREEDTAYSLMGIFNVSMPTGYGEGAEHAFMRLVKEILSSKLTSQSMLEIINWSSAFENGLSDNDICSNISSSALIPRSPHAYIHSSFDDDIYFHRSSFPITLSYMGLCVPVLLLPSNFVPLGYPENTFIPKGDYSATIYCADASGNCYTYNLLDSALFGNNSTQSTVGPVFAVLNIADNSNSVLLPPNGNCLAIKLFPRGPLDGWELPETLSFARERHHFTFDIVYHSNSSFQIPKDELNRHGITLRTMYL